MPSLEYFILARGTSADQFTNALTIFGVIEELTPRRIPAFLTQIVAIAGIKARADEIGLEGKIQLAAQMPDGQKFPPLDADYVLEGRRNRFLFHIMGFPINHEGEISFELTIDGSVVAHHHLLVNKPDAHASPDGWIGYPVASDSDAPMPAPQGAHA